MAKDQQGLSVSGSAASVAALDRAVADYYAWKGDPVAELQAAVDSDPGFALGPAAIASLYSLNGFRGGDPRITQALAQELPPGLAAVPLNPGIINTTMLRSCFSGRADGYPDAAEWAQIAAPFLLNINTADNGNPLTVPAA